MTTLLFYSAGGAVDFLLVATIWKVRMSHDTVTWIIKCRGTNQQDGLGR